MADKFNWNFFLWVLGGNFAALLTGCLCLGSGDLKALGYLFIAGAIMALNAFLAIVFMVQEKYQQASCFFLSGILVLVVGASTCFGF